MELEVVGGFNEPHTGFDTDWWARPGRLYLDNAIFLVVRDGAEEIARVELDQRVDPVQYRDARLLDGHLLEIQLIEVREGFRRRGLGTTIVQALSDFYPGRRLVAFSEDADDFWASLGWRRHLHRSDREPNPRHRPLYVQP